MSRGRAEAEFKGGQEVVGAGRTGCVGGENGGLGGETDLVLYGQDGYREGLSRW